MWLLTWNVYGRVRRRPEQAAAVLAAAADVIALQALAYRLERTLGGLPVIA